MTINPNRVPEPRLLVDSVWCACGARIDRYVRDSHLTRCVNCVRDEVQREAASGLRPAVRVS